MEDEVNVSLGNPFLLVDVLSRLDREDHPFIKQVLETVSLHPCEDQVIRLDFVHYVVELGVAGLYRFAGLDEVYHQLTHVGVQARFDNRLHHCLESHVKPGNIVTTPFLLHGFESLLFCDLLKFFPFSPGSNLGGFLGPPSLIDFLLDPSHLLHFCHLLLLFDDLEDVIVWLHWFFLLIGVVLHHLALSVEVLLEAAHVYTVL